MQRPPQNPPKQKGARCNVQLGVFAAHGGALGIVQVEGLEPSSSVWKTDRLAINIYLRDCA